MRSTKLQICLAIAISSTFQISNGQHNYKFRAPRQQFKDAEDTTGGYSPLNNPDGSTSFPRPPLENNAGNGFSKPTGSYGPPSNGYHNGDGTTVVPNEFNGYPRGPSSGLPGVTFQPSIANLQNGNGHHPNQPKRNGNGEHRTEGVAPDNYPDLPNGSGQTGVPYNPQDSQTDGEFEGDYSAIPGEPDKDYPIFSFVPDTSFSCQQQEYPGYYADVETRCQIFHICANNRTYDFICPNGTVFHQEYLVCVWWNQFDCNSAPSLFQINANIYDYSQKETKPQEGLHPSVVNDVENTGHQNGYPASSTAAYKAGSNYSPNGSTPPGQQGYTNGFSTAQPNGEFSNGGYHQTTKSGYSNGNLQGSTFSPEGGSSGLGFTDHSSQGYSRDSPRREEFSANGFSTQQPGNFNGEAKEANGHSNVRRYLPPYDRRPRF